GPMLKTAGALFVLEIIVIGLVRRRTSSRTRNELAGLRAGGATAGAGGLKGHMYKSNYVSVHNPRHSHPAGTCALTLGKGDSPRLLRRPLHAAQLLTQRLP